MKVVVSGHRQGSIGQGWNDHKFHAVVKKALWDYFDIIKPELLITGMALGVDQWAAQYCVRNNVPFIAAVPFKDQHLKWSITAQSEYNKLLKSAVKIVQVDRMPGYIDSRVGPDVYRKEKLFTRNKWMVDQIDRGSHDQLVAVLDTNRVHSGTKNCVKYAYDTFKGSNVVEVDISTLPGYTQSFPGGIKDDDVPF